MTLMRFIKSLFILNRLGSGDYMRMSESELQELLNRNKSLKCQQVKKKTANTKVKTVKNVFDSLAEEKYYNEYLYPLILIKEIESVELHKSFVIVSALPEYKLKAKEYTPDFIIHYPDGTIKVIEIKGKIIKKLQRDYQLRKHLFIEKYVLPNGWSFEEIASEEITGGNK